jgi:hypothetical protein
MNGPLVAAKRAGESAPGRCVPHANCALGAAGYQHGAPIRQAGGRHRMDRAPMPSKFFPSRHPGRHHVELYRTIVAADD